MVRESVIVTSPLGLHLRPANILCNEAVKYQSSVKFEFGNSLRNAKSILSVLSAHVQNGSEITIVCEGPDEQEALDAVVGLIRNGLGKEYGVSK
ncbi:MAG: HPr family phosphocarrier protein [Clostridiales bacterium]|nr:HPr family phosphocarrier protein [Clostridiales bacterium]